MGEEKKTAGGPVDLEGLAMHVIALSGRLERAWSEALDGALMEVAGEELNGEVSAFVTAMTDAVGETDDRLTAAGLDARIYSWPLDPEVFVILRPDPDPATRRPQLVIAQMIAVRELLAAFKALGEPSGAEIDPPSGSRTEWFEAGAFFLFRSRAMLLLRVTRQVDRASDVLLAEPAASKLDLSIEAAFDSLAAARGAYSRGDLDAAVIHCRAALRAVLESLPFIERGDERLLAPGALLAQVPSLARFAPALELLDGEAEALGHRDVDLGIAVPLVAGLLPVIAAIVAEPPIVEMQTIAAVDSEEG